MYCIWFYNNLDENKMFTPVTGKLYIKSIITVQGTSLVVKIFINLGITLTSYVKIPLCFQKTSVAYGMLEKLVWTNGIITH